MKIAFISSYVPKKCGIATYTKDLAQELEKQKIKTEIAAMEDGIKYGAYPSNVKYKIRQQELSDYKKVAEKLNKSDVDVVHIQHEFGLFGGEDGEYILDFASLLTKPFVVTFHTILLSPREKQKFIIQELSRISKGIIVMEAIAQDRLENTYGVNPHDISVIFHGVPEVSKISKPEAKSILKHTKSFLIIATNLISRNKGLEYAIAAIPQVIADIPNIKVLIIGETHPVVKKNEGEKYREELEDIVKKNKLENYVTFINRYITISEMKTFLAASDICITPYLDPQQITSGVLAYAVGAGKACISTPYIYAQHLLDEGRGVLVPFENSQAISAAILKIYKNPHETKLMEKKAYKLGRQMNWQNVATKHKELYGMSLKVNIDITEKAKKILLSLPDISHFASLTDQVGILQHAHYTIPESRFGYSTDDNARALIVVSDLYAKNKSQKFLSLLKIYLSFLRLAQEPSGRFHTFLNFQRLWIDMEEISDPYGKALWALGYHLYICPNSPFFQSVHSMFKTSIEHLDVVRDLRTAAYSILGLYYYAKAFHGKKDAARIAIDSIHKLSQFILMHFNNFQDKNWVWFEEKISYDNFRIPQALLASYMVTKEEKYKTVAIKTLEFIEKCNFDYNKNYFDFVGQNGWFFKNSVKAIYDQQPLEASAAVGAYTMIYESTRKKQYLDKAVAAFEWFFGRNRNHKIMYDKKTGGVYDGLTPTGVNMNEGAESIVSFLIAQISLKPYLKKLKD